MLSLRGILAIVIIIVVAVASVTYYRMTSFEWVSSTSTNSALSSFTYETTNSYSSLDPTVSYTGPDGNIFNNVYENLVWYNYTSSSVIIPWLASSYTTSADLSSYSFTLREGIQFADGEPFNSSAVYFSYNRLLILDGSTATTHGTQTAWIIQQTLNRSLSSAVSGSPQAYSTKWVDGILAENFVQVTGPYTVNLRVQHPDSAFLYELSGFWMSIMAPDYVMQHDLDLWNQASTGYTLPYPILSGNITRQINEYFMDEAATCNTGSTPSGCATTYLDGSYSGSQAGTGPYTIVSVDKSTSDIVLAANPNYWGGPYPTKVQPKISLIRINYVPDTVTREIDLRNAAASGQAMSIDLPNSNLYDVADRQAWSQNNTLRSIIPGVTIYGPEICLCTGYEAFSLNVTNSLTGEYYQFQPFADQRFRLAFADAVNISQSVAAFNNGVGQVALNSMPPALPPQGIYNASIKPIYSYNPDEVQNLLLTAMEHPITSFHFTNGTIAPPGFFNNTFGCSVLTNGQCSHPVPQTLTLAYVQGHSIDQGILTQIALTVNNVSSTYNMGLTVTVAPMSLGQLITQVTGTHLYMFGIIWGADYPWGLDFLNPFYNPGGTIGTSQASWNIPYLGQLYQQAANASARGDTPGVIRAGNAMDEWANQHVMYLWSDYVGQVYVMTSNVHGFYFNPSNYVGWYDPYYALLY